MQKSNLISNGYDALAAENFRIQESYEGGLSRVRNRAKLYDAFFRGKQYSNREKAQLRDFGLIPLVINIVRPLLSNRRAILVSSKPTWRVVPLQGGTKLIADALNQLLVGKWNSDYTDIQLNLALKDMLVAGYGCLYLDTASFLDNATFDIIIKRLSWQYVFPDPDCEEFDCSDAENILIKKRVGIKRAQVTYQMSDADARSACEHSDSGDWENQGVVVIDNYSKYPVEKWIAKPAKNAELREGAFPKVFYTHELKGIVDAEESAAYEKNKQLLSDMRTLESEKKIELSKLKELHIHRTISVGKRCVYNGIMNIRDYPVTIFINEHGGSFKDLLSEVQPLEGIQKAFNKFYLLTIHNAMLTGNFRVMGPEGAVTNQAQFQRTATLPGAYLPYKPDPSLPDGGRPIIIQPGALSSAFFGLSHDLMEKAKFETNVYSPTLGDPKGTPETFSTTASLQEFGSQPIKELARRVDVQISRLGETTIQFIQNYSRADELIEFIDIDGEVKAPKDESGNPIEFNKMVVKEGVVSEIKNNTRIGKYACKVLTQPNLGSDRMNKAASIRDMVMNKAVPPLPIIMGKLLDLMEFPGAKDVMQALEADSDSKGKIAQLEQQLKIAIEQGQMLQNETVRLGKSVKIAQFTAELDKVLLQLKATGTEEMRKLALHIESMMVNSEMVKQSEGTQ